MSYQKRQAGAHSRVVDVEQIDGVLRGSGELAQCDVDRLPSKKPSLVDGYKRGQFNLGIAEPGLIEGAQFGFSIYADPLRISGLKDVKFVRGHPTNNDGGRLNCGDDDAFVLANDVEAMELPKAFIPSLVRLERFDFGSFALGKPLYQFCSLVTAQGVELGFGVDNRKIAVFGLRHAVALRQCSRQNIKTASDCVDIGSRFNHEAKRERAFFDRYYKIVRDIRVRVFDDHFEVCLDPQSQALFEGWQLGYGPVDGSMSV